MKKTVLLVFALLFSIPLTFASQESAEEDLEYLYPTISFSGVQLNATVYRLHSGDTINLTFSFTTYEFVNFTLLEYYNTYHSIPGGEGRLNKFLYLDGIQTSRGYHDLGLKGSSSSLSKERTVIPIPGDHTIEWKWLFKVEEDGEGYLDIDFYGVNAYMHAWSPETPVEVPFWMQWWFWTTVVVVIVLVGAVYLLKKRKPPTAPTSPAEGTV